MNPDTAGPDDVVDLFAGPGGWDVAAVELGLDPLGIEVDADACATRLRAGLRTRRGGVDALAPRAVAPHGIRGLIASPPCPAFSKAGSRTGHDDLGELIRRAHTARAGWHDDLLAGHVDGRDLFGAGWHDHTSPLVLEPLRWAAALEPRWVALEQVPEVLPVWRAIAETLAAWGFHVWTGNLLAADYGVPQTRLRAVLIASRDHDVEHPEPSHAKGGTNGRLPWVSMATALGWAPDGVIRTGANTERGGGRLDPYERSSDEPSPTVIGNTGRWLWTSGAAPHRPNRKVAVRHQDEPAPTIAIGHAAPTWLNTGRDWTAGEGRETAQRIAIDEPAPTLTAKSGGQWQWWHDRPATTVAGDARIAAPGHKVGRADDAVRITVAEALVLQGFPADYPVAGNLTAAYKQVGNAVPPPLARAILTEVVR